MSVRLGILLSTLFIIATLPPLATAGGGGSPDLGGIVRELNFIETPTYILSILFAFFLFVSLAFERIVHILLHYFKKKKRFGLVASVNALVLELTLVGFVSLILTAIEQPISTLCVSYDAGDFHDWTLISALSGCNCCLKDTTGVSTCFKRNRNCGYEYCNCGYPAENTCPYGEPMIADAIDVLFANASCSCKPEYEEQIIETLDMVQETLVSTCDEMVPISEGCPAGSTYLISPETLHQVHIFIFVVAVTHVCMSILMIVVASWRIRIWKRWKEDENDEYSQAARERLADTRDNLPGHRLRHTSQLYFKKMFNRPISRFSKRSLSPHSPDDDDSADLEAAKASSLSNKNGDGVDAAENSEVQTPQVPPPPPPPPVVEKPPPSPAPEGDNNNNNEDNTRKSIEKKGSGSAFANVVFKAVEKAYDGNSNDSEIKREDSGVDGSHVDFSGDIIESPDTTHQVAAMAGVERRHGPKSLKRLTTFSTKKESNVYLEFLISFVQQFNVQAVKREQFNIMRASFILTHRVPPTFDFMDYILNSMEDDLSQVVGISVEMWLTLMIFLLISGVLGWAMLIFLCIAAVLLATVNTKLMQIIRHVCKDGKVSCLASNVFWFKRPSLLLIPIKFVLFLCSFNTASTIFFVWQFGVNSCYTSTDFWFAWSWPWWCSLVISWGMFLDLAFKTIPMYSLAVQMGSDFKHNMLPTGLKRRLLQIAAHAREQVAARAKENSVSASETVKEKMQNMQRALQAKMAGRSEEGEI